MDDKKDKDRREELLNSLSYFWNHSDINNFARIEDACAEFPSLKVAYDHYVYAKNALGGAIDRLTKELI